MKAVAKTISLILLGGLIAWAVVGCSGGSSAPQTPSGPVSTSTTLTSSASSVSAGGTVTLTATVTPAAASGSVTFYNGTTSLGTANLSSGTATLTPTFNNAGTATLTATYSGSSAYSASTSGGVALTINASSASPTPAAATFIYVIQTSVSGSEVLQFTAGANGSVSPTATLTPPTGFEATAIAVDSTGQIYLAGSLPSGVAVVEVYAAGASGSATPLRLIPMTDGYPPTAIAVSSAGALYTVDGDSVLAVYAGAASGAPTGFRAVTGVTTGLGYPGSVAVDSAGNAYVSEGPVGTAPAAILVFSSTASGNVAPTRTITTSGTNVFVGVTIDPSGNLFASVDTIVQPYTSSIVEYAANANGAATPTRTISGSAVALSIAGGLCVDGAGTIYAANQIPVTGGFTYSLETFSSTASGNIAPIASLTSSSWTNGSPQIAIR